MKADKVRSDFKSSGFLRRLSTMLAVDTRRMFTTSMFYIFCGVALFMPVLVLVMTTMVGGTSQGEGADATAAIFTNTWQIIATESLSSDMMSMDMTVMMNINLMFFMAGIFVCLFVSQDFKSGYAKNLFTVRAKKGDYVASKTITGFIAGAAFLVMFFIGAILGGSVAGLSFDFGHAGMAGLVMCMLAKIFLMSVFVAIFLVMSVIGKQHTWLSIMLSLFAGMLLFMMIPMMTPLDSGVGNVGMCLFGGLIFAVCIGLISRTILGRTSLV